MGMVEFGIPKKEALFLKNLLNLDVFVESGTYRGGTAVWASKNFNKVYTIEKLDVMYEVAKKNVSAISNIILIKGDTREELAKIISKNENILFWLDSHWSGGDSYGEGDECPLIEELRIIFKYQKNYAILIDDARLFLAPPPKPHNFKQWPSLKDIVNIMPVDWEILIYEDVIYLNPDFIKNDFKSFIQYEVTEKWNKSVKKKALIVRVFEKIGINLC